MADVPLVVAAFRSGAVMGFLLAGNGLLVVFLTIMVYKKVSLASSEVHIGQTAICVQLLSLHLTQPFHANCPLPDD